MEKVKPEFIFNLMANKRKKKKTVAVIGYGSQGRALALNLRDSGWPVIVGLRPSSRSRTLARREGMTDIRTIAAAAGAASIIIMAVPDHVQKTIYNRSIKKKLRRGQTLLFLHGLTIHFGQIEPPSKCDVVMLAPHAPGKAVREKYLTDQTVSAFYAISNNRSGHARQIIFQIAGGIGIAKDRLFKTSFEHEAIGDLFGEQAVLCGGLAGLVKTGFEVLVKKGIPAEYAYLEVAYQLDLIVALIKQHGLEGMLKRVSVAARMGATEAAPFLIDDSVRARMETLAGGVISGDFATRLSQMSESDIKRLNRRVKSLTNPAFEKAARKFSR